MKPLLLDLFCGQGGASMGYHRAGFDVIGVDWLPQPRYPFRFIQASALDVLEDFFMHSRGSWMERVVAAHASPPCQRFSDMADCRPGLAEEYPDLIDPTRELLQALDVPWVMENVEGSSLLSQPDLFGGLHGITLCGHMFGLKLYRHRLFESNISLSEPPHPRHLTPGGSAGHWKPGEIISVAGNVNNIELAREAMGIDWMTRDGLAESIPPAFTEYIGNQLLQVIQEAA